MGVAFIAGLLSSGQNVYFLLGGSDICGLCFFILSSFVVSCLVYQYRK
jgi:hypothetical protein